MAETNDRVRDIESGTYACIRQYVGAFYYRSAINFRMMTDAAAACDNGTGTDLGVVADKCRRENASKFVNARAFSGPDAWANLDTNGLECYVAEECVHGETAKVSSVFKAVDVSAKHVVLTRRAELAEFMAEQEGSIIAARRADRKDVEWYTIGILGGSDAASFIEMKLNQFFEIDFRICAYTDDKHEFGASLGEIYECVLRSAPEVLARSLSPSDVRPDYLSSVGQCSGSFAHQSHSGNSESLQASNHATQDCVPKYVEESDGDSADCFGCRAGRLTSHQQYGSYIHGDHLGAAARNIAERDGTQDGIRRNREIGSSARAL